MPELPEVETVRKSLQALVKGKSITGITVHLPRLVRHPDDVEEFKLLLIGQTIDNVRRRGKFLLLEIGSYILVSHLRMEGRYGLYRTDEPMEKHTHVIFHFSDGTELRYKDVRQFGTFDLLTESQLDKIPGLRTMGPEPFEESFTVDSFYQRMRDRKTKIKPLLLDQSFLAGLGNIYVDEALYQAGIHPERLSSSLKKQEVSKLYHAIRDILSDSIELGGSSVKSYVNGFGSTGGFQFKLKVYGKDKTPCNNCGTPIEKSRVGGRGTHFCPQCQQLPKTPRKSSN